MGKLKWPFASWDELDDYALHLIQIRNAHSTLKTWAPVYQHWFNWCKLYDVNPHDKDLLANQKTLMRFLAYRMKFHNIGSSWARSNAYVLRDWWMQNNVICRVDSKAMPFVHSMFKGRDVEKPPGLHSLLYILIL